MTQYHLILKVQGQELIVPLNFRPRVGQSINIKAGGRIHRMTFDGMGWFTNQPVNKPVVAEPANEPAPAKAADKRVPRHIPEWALNSADPRIEQLVLESEYKPRDFFALLYDGAWKDALLVNGDAAQEDNNLALRWIQLDAAQARAARRAAGKTRHIKDATNSKDVSTPEDAVLYQMHSQEQEAASDLETALSERRDTWGPEKAHVDWQMDVVRQMMAHAGIADVHVKEPLASVIATVMARREAGALSEKQLNFIYKLAKMIGEDKIEMVEWDAEEAFDEWEQQQAVWDNESHPVQPAPVVAVSPERQGEFLKWAVKKEKETGAPWFKDPVYLSVLEYAANGGGARTPKQAGDMAYAAFQLKWPKNILGYDKDQGFLVKLNGKGDTGLLTGKFATVAYKQLPPASKKRMQALRNSA
jgi:hypothetical protein